MRVSLVLIAALVAPLPAAFAQLSKVRIIYLVPSDRTEQADYVASMTHAIQNLQIWYRNELGTGDTFFLNDPVVETIPTPHNASWYATNPNGDNYLQFWNNVLDDAGPLTGWSFNDPLNRWIFYIDADPACGQLGGGGTSGVAMMGANDLRGLAGETTLAPCPEELPDTAPRCRWVGGLGHELGHAFNLPHPPECDDGLPTCPWDALMFLGFRDYADTFFLPADKTTLGESPFFDFVDLPSALPPCEIVSACPVDAYMALENETVVATMMRSECLVAIGPDLRIEFPGNLAVRYGDAVSLRNGFFVGPGASFTVEVDPLLKP